MKILKNYAYNLSYQLLVIVLPVITTPYITRVFNSDNLGTYGYFNSIVTYFILLATLGVANYGTKEISGHRKEIRRSFWGIYTLQLGATILSSSLYALLCLSLSSMQNPVAYILGFSLLSKGLDISWLFQGLEDFRKITVRNITVKLVGVISIFLFVKSAKDLYLYVFLLTIFELLGQLSMWVPAQEFIGKPHMDIIHAKKHLKPVILLFLPQIAISLYVTLDRTMLGALASKTDVGIYDQALKLINILLTLVTSLGSVMLPRVSSLLSKSDYKAVKKMYQLSFLIYNLVIFPIIAGMLLVNDDFVQFFLGRDFQDARYAIAIMIFRMFFIGWTNIMGIQILIPHNKNKEFMISTTVPAIVSVGLNLILLSNLGFIGAAIVSVLTEALVWGIQLYFTRPYLKEVPIIGSMIKIVVASGIMYALLALVKTIVHVSPTVNVILYAVLGGVIYVTLILLFKVVNLKELKQQLLKNREI
ncbi:flippase [Streptococcus oralis]|uniref:flippase n=1 Tax=Streptococcus oralis TaxID=1303 RepID=UPI002285326E|nr:flippase [Streptococcus oralis]MCY7070083.1 flippase [Streptococcus oralis]